VQPERCISCGHCVKVCSQNAKYISSNVGYVQQMLDRERICAIVAPSFAASFPEDYLKLPSALRKLGFEIVCETAFGADLIAQSYTNLYECSANGTVITSSCPAINNYIEKYFENLVPMLAPIVSPMIAMGKYIKSVYSDKIKVVFIGPCIAKKSEYIDPEVEGIIDSVLTFAELKELFSDNNINISECSNDFFDPPLANLGKSFPIAGGLLKTIGLKEDILAKERIVVDGKIQVEQIIKDIYENKIENKFIDILFCEGCINGPAIDSNLNYYSKREKVIDYIEEAESHVDHTLWKSQIFNARNLNFDRKFEYKHQRKPMPTEEKIREILERTNKFSKKDELNCGACGYQTCREYAISIAKGLAEDDMCLPFLLYKVEAAYKELKETQKQLHNAEKLASIGQLAAGVAHEINNPLGTIMMYSGILKKKYQNEDYVFIEDLNLIIEEAKRCKNIVSNLLNFAREGRLRLSEFNVYKLLDDILNKDLYNSLINYDVKINSFSSEILITADYDQLKEVFLNIINNAIEAMEDSSRKNLTINLLKQNENIIIEFHDTGCGIKEEYLNKIFVPFFTTKKIGKGTGLGLAIAYGIIKMHNGEISVESKLNQGTVIKITLHINQN
jgi:iron only hydrogenase large subunit-like protein